MFHYTSYFTCFTAGSFRLTEVWRVRNSPEFTLAQAASGEKGKTSGLRRVPLSSDNQKHTETFDCGVVWVGDGCAGGYGVGADTPSLSRQNRWIS